MGLLLKFYQKSLVKYPIVVQAVQSGILMGTGDIISQTVIEKRSFTDINWKRTAQFGSVGLFIGGPGLRIWYGVLNKYVGSTGRNVALKKVFLDQIIFAPIFVGALLGTIGAIQGQSIDENVYNLKKNYPDVMYNNYKLWPWVQLANFYLIPLNYQVLLVQVVAVFWNTYISWKTHIHLEKNTLKLN